MSIASPFGSNAAASIVDAQRLRTLAVRPVQTTAFWSAVLIPLSYPLLLYGGLNGQELSFLLAALAVNAAALVLGRNHNRDHA